ncbi:hypothetical protein [Geothrix sp. 21YS21S-2]|uniref:hypothetical protein n=1 Tax=Geothrix sp. 21YS21S-2 TaxID=3068893 RepID=UPI0027BA381E|nr:hypothetical protein [Geothrix sp. 21YS21S-2]
MDSLVADLKRIAETGDPYFKRVADLAEPVKIFTIRQNPMLKSHFEFTLNEFIALPNKCYDNASLLALFLERYGVTYVEGFVRTDTGIQSHAWIGWQGRYYDPTYEQNARDLKTPGNWRANYQYAKVIELSATEAWANCIPGGRDKEQALPAPLSIAMWGFNDFSMMIYALKHQDPDQLITLLKDPKIKSKLAIG